MSLCAVGGGIKLCKDCGEEYSAKELQYIGSNILIYANKNSSFYILRI